MTQPADRPLDQRLAELARDVDPPGHLWNGIAAGIARKHRHDRPKALAAAAACAILTGGLIWAVLHEKSAATREALPTPSRGYGQPLDARYTAASSGLESTFHERLALLDPATRVKVESSLTVIRQAHEDIRKALAAEPANPVLEQLFESTWHDEIDLYDRVVRGTQPSLARI